MEQGKLLDKPFVIIESFNKTGLQKVEIWKDRTHGTYFAIPENGKAPENTSFIGMTKLMIN
jgi:hypothetical protein